MPKRRQKGSGGDLRHDRHSADREFDLRCEACGHRVSRKMRADLRQKLLGQGLSDERADELLADLDRIAAEFNSDAEA